MNVGVRVFRKDKYRNSSQLTKALERAMDNVVKPHYIKQFDEVVYDWESVAFFSASKRIFVDNSIHLYVYPKGRKKDVWYYVDRGTRPHKIRAVEAPMLMFPFGTYFPKTSPVANTGGLGDYLGVPETVATYEVDHPGNEPRYFTREITLSAANRKVFTNAISRAVYEVFK